MDMPQRPILRTAKFSNLGENIGQQQRLQWSTFMEGAIPEDERSYISHSLNRSREARDMVPGAYLWLPDPYRYEPLPNDYRAIRLIEISPGPEDSIIKCTMHHAMLDSAYTCLSFASEPSADSVDSEDFFISVDKRRLQVSQGLWSFLQFARLHRITERLWIEEICINSKDLDEKNQQISLVPWIYRSANSTIAWLESPDLSTSTGIPDLSILEYAATRAQENEALDSTWLSSRTFAIQTFLFLPYWWRLHTAQELLLSRNIHFLTFTDESSLSAIYALFAGLTRAQNDFPDLYHAMMCSPVFTLFSIVRKAFNKWNKTSSISTFTSTSDRTSSNKSNPTGLPLHYLMQAFKFNDCIDPHDRIYAILGLVNKGDMFEVDYREPIPALLRRTWETFRPKKRSMAKLLFADLLETMELDESVLPFYLASRRVYSPTTSETQKVDELLSTERSKLEIREKSDWMGEAAWAYGVDATTSAQVKTHLCRNRSRCCANGNGNNATNARRWRPKFTLCQSDPTLPLGLISCWQV